MVTLDERVAYLEGRVEEQTRQTDGIREALVNLEARIDRQFFWLVGIQVTTLASMLAAFSAILVK